MLLPVNSPILLATLVPITNKKTNKTYSNIVLVSNSVCNPEFKFKKYPINNDETKTIFGISINAVFMVSMLFLFMALLRVTKYNAIKIAGNSMTTRTADIKSSKF